MSEVQKNSEELLGAFLHSAETPVIVMAEELPLEGGGIDYKKHFWEPQTGKNYTIKFLTNPGGEPLTHRKVYKNLPDPKRKGKNFQVVSSGSSNTCKVLELFFELYNLKKNGDPLAIQKLDKFLGVTNQACALVQIISSPDPEEVGMFRMFTFSTFGPNPTIANLVNNKLNPTKEAMDNGFEKEDIFNIFNSSVLMIQCEESEYDGRKGREYGKSAWAPKKRGAFINLTDDDGNPTGERHEFSLEDIVDGKFASDKAKKAFDILVKELTNPDLSIHNYFAYKYPGHPKNTEESEKYIKTVQEKVDEIVPIIKDAKDLSEIARYGVNESTTENSDSASLISGKNAADILKDSAPSELSNSILNDTPEEVKKEIVNTSASSNPDVSSILDS